MLHILDGSGYMFRAYYALPPLTDKEGNNKNAIYWFLKMLISLLKQKPTYFALTRDHPSQTLREKEFEQYKATRPPIPDDFKAQIGQIKQIPAQIWVPSLEIPWYEADDIIFTLVEKFKKQTPITIISSDKDLKQLITDNVVFWDPMKKQQIDITSFEQKRGFKPPQIVDYLALLWDSSDNIPGVNGIWAKTALSLIQKFSNLDQIYQNLDQISPSTKEKLIQGKQNAYLSKDLITLKSVPQLKELKLDELKLNIDFDEFEKLALDLGFPSLQKQVQNLKKDFQKPQQNSLF